MDGARCKATLALLPVRRGFSLLKSAKREPQTHPISIQYINICNLLTGEGGLRGIGEYLLFGSEYTARRTCWVWFGRSSQRCLCAHYSYSYIRLLLLLPLLNSKSIDKP